MTDETREQIDTDAIVYAVKTYGEKSEVLEASIIWDDGKADFAAGATHQHPISYEAGRKAGIEEAIGLAKDLAVFANPRMKKEFIKELEALKTEKP